MRRLILILWAALSAVSSMTAAKTDNGTNSVETLRREMEPVAARYLDTQHKPTRRAAIAEMNEIDSRIKQECALAIVEQIDTVTATARDYRRNGVRLRAMGYEEAAQWFLYRGAALGDQYCVNYALVQLLISDQNPAVALELFKMTDSGIYPPLYHNMALAFSRIDNPEVRRIGQMLGELYFEIMDDPDTKYGPYDLNEYITYIDDPWLIQLGKAWTTPGSRKAIGGVLKEFMDSGK